MIRNRNVASQYDGHIAKRGVDEIKNPGKCGNRHHIL
jgi:hypothetical protein